ncbi:MAG: YdcF family protein [Rhodospirillales bacterium]
MLLAVGLGGLTLLSLPVASGSLVALLELGLARPPPPGPPPQAVVILSGDQQRTRVGNSTLYIVGPLTLEREQAGAALARRTGAPVLVSGGALHPWSPPLADLMAASLHQDFATDVRWRETQSIDTWGNAQDSAAILRAAGITRVWVVTHGWHMPRALVAFRRAGLDAVPAPVLIDAPPDFYAASFIPSARAWLESYYAMHELIGWAWYELRP